MYRMILALLVVSCYFFQKNNLKKVKPTSSSKFAVSKLFSTNMVLQREMPINIWGTATAKKKITLTFKDSTYSVFSDAKGNWNFILPAMSIGGPYTMELNAEKKAIIINDILIGDVWLCAGQSNMRRSISRFTHSEAFIESATDSNIRIFNVPIASSVKPDTVLKAGKWIIIDSTTVGRTTAIGYHFARELRQQVAVPIGLIHSSYEGSRIEAWMNVDNRPVSLQSSYTRRVHPALLYNSMIHPLKKMPIKGVLWYQGESNTDTIDDAIAYQQKFKDLIHNWRAIWNIGNFPFLYVQLPNFKLTYKHPCESIWASLRAAQSSILKENNTAQIVTIDIGESDNLHPNNKQEVGRRLAVAARKLAYKEHIIYSGPTYKNHRIIANKVYVNFNHIADSLVSRGSEKINGFELAASNKIFVKAEAIIKNNQVIIQNEEIAEPVFIRYAWSDNPDSLNLFNSAALPACPFQSEDIVITRPIYKEHEIIDEEIIISFENIGKGLTVKDKQKVIDGFSMADQSKKFIHVKATLKNNKVFINHAVENPVYVRYDPSLLNLYNSAGLPVSPFMIDAL